MELSPYELYEQIERSGRLLGQWTSIERQAFFDRPTHSYKPATKLTVVEPQTSWLRRAWVALSSFVC